MGNHSVWSVVVLLRHLVNLFNPLISLTIVGIVGTEIKVRFSYLPQKFKPSFNGFKLTAPTLTYPAKPELSLTKADSFILI